MRRVSQEIAECLLDPEYPSWTEPRHGLESPVVGGGLEVFEGIHMKVFFDSFCELLTNAGDRRKDGGGGDLTFETLEDFRLFASDEFPNHGRQAVPDSGQIFEGVRFAGLYRIRKLKLQISNCSSTGAIGAYPKDACVLSFE